MSYPAPHVLQVCLLAARCESIQHWGRQGMIDLYLYLPSRKEQSDKSTVEITTIHLCIIMVGCQGYSVKEFVDACIKVTGANIKVEYGPRRPGDYAEVFSDPSKAKDELVRGRSMLLVVVPRVWHVHVVSRPNCTCLNLFVSPRFAFARMFSPWLTRVAVGLGRTGMECEAR
eukprot:COSAG02_NODE_4501_length_5288_cov_7.650029_3_plen_172_part_00